MANNLPKNGRLHGPVRARSRRETRQVYEVLEMKRDLHNQFMYDRVEDVYSSFYGGLDPRRRKESADAGMVQEDRNAMSNLSPVGYQREYPRAGYYSSPYIDDSVKD